MLGENDRQRVVRQGMEAWSALKTEKNWAYWVQVGEALQVGREDAMLEASTNQPIGSRYNGVFGKWLVRHKLDDMDKSDRSRLLAVMENRAAIEAWRMTLTLTERIRLNNPNVVLRKWKAATSVPVPKEKKPGLRDFVANLDEERHALKSRVAELEAQLEEVRAADPTAPSFVVTQAADELLSYSVWSVTTSVLERIREGLGDAPQEPGVVWASSIIDAIDKELKERAEGKRAKAKAAR